MFIIEFEDGVYATKGTGDPARTLRIKNAQRFSERGKAERKLTKIIEDVKSFRKLPKSKVRWVDEVTGKLSDQG